MLPDVPLRDKNKYKEAVAEIKKDTKQLYYMNAFLIINYTVIDVQLNTTDALEFIWI